MVRRSPRLAATKPPATALAAAAAAGKPRKAAAEPDNQSHKSFEVELDVGSILGAITERMFEHTSHRMFDYYADLVSSTYDKELKLDYICNLLELLLQTTTLTKDAKKRETLFAALAALNESVFGMMDVPLAKKIRLSIAVRHLQRL